MICEKCGLPKEICVCGELDKEDSIILIKTRFEKWNKPKTVIEGVPDPKPLARKFKKLLCTGGTVKEGIIILNGLFGEEVFKVMTDNGFKCRLT